MFNMNKKKAVDLTELAEHLKFVAEIIHGIKDEKLRKEMDFRFMASGIDIPMNTTEH